MSGRSRTATPRSMPSPSAPAARAAPQAGAPVALAPLSTVNRRLRCPASPARACGPPAGAGIRTARVRGSASLRLAWVGCSGCGASKVSGKRKLYHRAGGPARGPQPRRTDGQRLDDGNLRYRSTQAPTSRRRPSDRGGRRLAGKALAERSAGAGWRRARRDSRGRQLLQRGRHPGDRADQRQTLAAGSTREQPAATASRCRLRFCARARRTRRTLLRAHPLLDDGVIDLGTGSAFGRSMIYGNGEAQRWLGFLADCGRRCCDVCRPRAVDAACCGRIRAAPMSEQACASGSPAGGGSCAWTSRTA